MKRKATTALFAALLVFALVVTGCAQDAASPAETGNGEYMPRPKNPEVLSPETEEKIKQTYVKEIINGEIDMSFDSIYIDKYYGTYDGCVAVMMHDTYKCSSFNDMIWEVYVADVLITYMSGNRIKIWKKNQFYDMQTAYDKGLLTREDIQSIAYYQSHRDPFQKEQE